MVCRCSSVKRYAQPTNSGEDLYKKYYAYATNVRDREMTLLYDEEYNGEEQQELPYEEKVKKVMDKVEVPTEFLYELAAKRGAAVQQLVLQAKEVKNSRFEIAKPDLSNIKYKGTGAFFELK